MLPQPTLRHVADLTIKLDPIVEMGQGQGGTRRIIPIIGGQVSGPAFSGEIMNVGADWQTIFASGLAELDTREPSTNDDITYGIEIAFWRPNWNKLSDN